MYRMRAGFWGGNHRSDTEWLFAASASSAGTGAFRIVAATLLINLLAVPYVVWVSFVLGEVAAGVDKRQGRRVAR